MMTAFKKAWAFLKGTPLEQSGFEKPISMDPKYGEYQYHEDEGFLAPHFNQQITTHYPAQLSRHGVDEADSLTGEPEPFPADSTSYGESKRAPDESRNKLLESRGEESQHAGLTRLQNPATQDILRRFAERAANEHVGFSGQMEHASEHGPGTWNYGKNYPNVENLRDIYGDPLRPIPALDMDTWPSAATITQQRHEDRPPSGGRRRERQENWRLSHPPTPLEPHQDFAENWGRMERGE